MSKPVNDVRASSTDARYVGIVFEGPIEEAIAQAKVAPDFGLPDADIRAPKGMSRDRAALLGFLRLLPVSPLAQSPGAPFSVLSAEHSDASVEDNAAATAMLRKYLYAEQFATVQGKYKGATETAFAVLTPTAAARMYVNGLARAFGQESILHVDADRRAVLQYFDGRTVAEHIGTWQTVASVEGLDAYTIDGSGQAYAVKGAPPLSKYSLAWAQARGIVPGPINNTVQGRANAARCARYFCDRQ